MEDIHLIREAQQIKLLAESIAKIIESDNDKTKSPHELNQEIEGIDQLNSTVRNFLEVVSARKTISREFLTKIHHELRTPLVPILAYTDMLLDSKYGSISDEQRKRLEIINSSTKGLVQTIQELFNEKTFDVTSDNPEAGKDHKINELKQEKKILDRINTALSDELEKTKEENIALKKDLKDGYHKIREREQEKMFVSKDAQDKQEKNLRLQKKHILTIACSIAVVGIVITAYSLFVVELVGQQYRVPNTSPVKSSYVIQDLQGDTIDTWISWRLADGAVIHVNVADAKKYSGKLDLVKEVVLSKESIEIDDSLLQKGPKGSTSTYYIGWAGALEEANKKPTEFIIPTEFDVIESSRGAGEITIRLTDERSGDGYSGFTKSIADPTQNQILKSDITIYEVNKLSDDQFKTILRHELGHAWGLAHSSATEDLMAPIIKTEYPYISECDIDAIKSLYDGNKKSDVVCEK
jgi:hypothetical protein